jgi:DNA-binding response OmpR family regulator
MLQDAREVLGMAHDNKYRILLVDDDPNCLDAVDQILRREGYMTFPTDAGQAALEIAAKQNIDLAIVDFDLLDTDGLYVLREIKRMRRDLPVIIMTARDPREVRLAALEAGAYTFMPKPINIPNFKQIVARALHSPRTKTVTVRRQLVVTRWIRWIRHK